jgi:hypothetical protein
MDANESFDECEVAENPNRLVFMTGSVVVLITFMPLGTPDSV